ncbi:MAG: tautomerase family protein [Abditibacteriota bacterium]|nr:tautomerase family protein [Abditibacteriota bacterium]
MPHISVTMHPGRTPEQKEALAGALKRALTDSLGCPEGVVSVSVAEVPPEKWQEHLKSFPEESMLILPDKKKD